MKFLAQVKYTKQCLGIKPRLIPNCEAGAAAFHAIWSLVTRVENFGGNLTSHW